MYKQEVDTLDGTWLLKKMIPFVGEKKIIKGIILTFTDITDIKRTQLELRAKHKLLTNYASQVPGILYQLEQFPNGSITMPFVNERIKDIFGCSPEDVKDSYKPVSDRIHPDDLKILKRVRKKSAEDMSPIKIEFRINNKNNNESWIRCNSIPEKTSYGSIIWSGFMEDITERKKSEYALKESEERLKAFLENGLVIAWLKDEDGRHVFHSSNYERRYGRKSKGWIGKTEFEIWPRDIAEEMVKNDRKVVETGNSIEAIEKTIDSEGSDIYWNTTKFSYTDSMGRTFIGGLGVDITEQLKSEIEIADQKRIYEIIIEESLAGYWDWNLTDDTEYLSPAFKEMFGYTDDELENSPETWKKLIFPEDLPGVEKNYKEHIQSGGKIPYYNEIRYRHKNGSTVWVICAGRVVSWNDDGDAVRLVGCHINVTELKKFEIEREELIAELKIKSRQAEEDAKIKSNLLDEVNHRVKNNLMRIQSLLQLKTRELKKDSQERDILSDMVLRIDGMLTVHTQLSNSLWMSVDMDILCGRIITGVLEGSPKRGSISVHIEFEPEAGSTVKLRPGQATAIALILNELTMNSIKYAFRDRDSGQIELKLVLEDTARGRSIRLIFRDDGPGWPEDALHKKNYGLGFHLIEDSIRNLPDSSLFIRNNLGAETEIRFRLEEED